MTFIDIIGTLFDNSVNHIVAIANQIFDQRLERNQQDINEDIYNKLSQSSSNNFSEEQLSTINSGFTSEDKTDFDNLKNNDFQDQINNLKISKANIGDSYTKIESDAKYLTEHQDISGKANVGDSYTKEESDSRYLQSQINHVFLTQQEYNNLESYQNNTLYFILDSEENEEVGIAFGDKLPIRFSWVFGKEFPVTLS